MNNLKDIRQFDGSSFFRLRIAYSMLTKVPIKISNIRTNDVNPGVTASEKLFLDLVSALSNGTEIDLNRTGTTLRFTPGVITNNLGKEVEFHCGYERSIVYFLEGIIPIALFGKESCSLKLLGITDDNIDSGFDRFNYVTLSLMQKLVEGDKFKCKLVKRGLRPNGFALKR